MNTLTVWVEEPPPSAWDVYLGEKEAPAITEHDASQIEVGA